MPDRARRSPSAHLASLPTEQRGRAASKVGELWFLGPKPTLAPMMPGQVVCGAACDPHPLTPMSRFLHPWTQVTRKEELG